MSIDDDVALLERVPSFSTLGHEVLRVLAIGSESRTMEEGEVLFYEGETADCGYVIEEGLLQASPRGRGTQPILMARGTLVGELSLITETRRPVTVRAAEPSSVMRIPRALFLKTLQGFPEMAERLRQTLLRRTEQLASDLGSVRRALDIGPEAPAAARAEPAPEQSA